MGTNKHRVCLRWQCQRYIGKGKLASYHFNKFFLPFSSVLFTFVCQAPKQYNRQSGNVQKSKHIRPDLTSFYFLLLFCSQELFKSLILVRKEFYSIKFLYSRSLPKLTPVLRLISTQQIKCRIVQYELDFRLCAKSNLQWRLEILRMASNAVQ